MLDPMSNVALSTCWCSHRHTDGHAMLREIADLGFNTVELSHGIRLTLVPGILRALEEGIVTVGSTHNFCPLPVGVDRAAPNIFQPSAPTAEERDMWLRHTMRSIDFAAQVGAGIVVVHLGSVGFRWFHPGRRLRAWRERHPGVTPSASEAFRRRLARAEIRWGRVAEEWRSRMVDSLGKVAEHALAKKVRLGFENRERWEELPRDHDFPALFEDLPPGFPAGVWFDCGHAQIKADLGLMEPGRWLEAQAGRLMGFHLHDVDADGHDHRPIGSGRVDFGMIRGFVKPGHRVVLELAPDVAPREVVDSRERIERWGVGTGS